MDLVSFLNSFEMLACLLHLAASCAHLIVSFAAGHTNTPTLRVIGLCCGLEAIDCVNGCGGYVDEDHGESRDACGSKESCSGSNALDLFLSGAWTRFKAPGESM